MTHSLSLQQLQAKLVARPHLGAQKCVFILTQFEDFLRGQPTPETVFAWVVNLEVSDHQTCLCNNAKQTQLDQPDRIWLHDQYRMYNRIVRELLEAYGLLELTRSQALQHWYVPQACQLIQHFLSPVPNPSWVGRRN
jgi:hypothetical protein